MDEFPVGWELVSQDATAMLTTYRLRVPGGWLVAVKDSTHSMTNVTNVEDPQGTWKLEA